MPYLVREKKFFGYHARRDTDSVTLLYKVTG